MRMIIFFLSVRFKLFQIPKCYPLLVVVGGDTKAKKIKASYSALKHTRMSFGLADDTGGIDSTTVG